MVVFCKSYEKFILDKPIYVMSIKTALRKNGNKIEELSKTITTGAEASLLISSVREMGLINLV